MICKYFLPFPFYSVDSFPRCIKDKFWCIWFFVVVDCAFGVISQKCLPNPTSWSFFLFSSKNFILLALIFKSLVHFEFTFVYNVRKGFTFTLLLFLPLQASGASLCSLSCGITTPVLSWCSQGLFLFLSVFLFYVCIL